MRFADSVESLCLFQIEQILVEHNHVRQLALFDRAKFILSAQFRLGPDDPHRILRQVKQIWIYKKNSQPLAHRNAGCVFKNPRGMSAGALIDKSGLKGHRVGGAHVSEKHANFIIADDGPRASDVLKLINIIRETVYKRAEVYLELELEVW